MGLQRSAVGWCMTADYAGALPGGKPLTIQARPRHQEIDGASGRARADPGRERLGREDGSGAPPRPPRPARRLQVAPGTQFRRGDRRTALPADGRAPPPGACDLRLLLTVERDGE